MAATKIELPYNTWTLVAQDTTSGVIDITKYDDHFSSYQRVFVPTGNAGPSGSDDFDTQVNVRGKIIEIKNSTPLDVYMRFKLENATSDNGEVVVGV